MMTKNELYQKAFKKWGDLQLVVAIEEMSELQKELCKALRGNHNLSEIVEEVADVEIMLEQIKQIFRLGISVEAVKENKLKRLEERLNNPEAENVKDKLRE